MKRLAVFASGRGSNFKAIIDHVNMGILQNVTVSLLVTNVAHAPAIELARKKAIPVELIEGVFGRKFASKQEREEARGKFDRKAVEVLAQNRVDLVALAGFMQVLGSTMIDAYELRIMNIHPAKDLTRFGGTGMFGDRVHEAVIRSGEKESGCTVHYVDKSMDGGPILLQSTVPVKPGDTPEKLARRILIHEHRTYSKTIQLHVDDRIRIKDKNVSIDRTGNWESAWNLRQEVFIQNQMKESHEYERLIQSST